MRDGIEDVHSLGLNAMEVQMVRVNVIDRFPDEEEVGLTPLEVVSDLIVEIERVKGKKSIRITDPEEEIREDDTLITLASGLVQNFEEVRDLGKMGREFDVELSIPTPYYMDLVSNSDLTERCIDNIRWAGTIANQMGGGMVVTHLGLYGDGDREEAKRSIVDNVAAIMEWWEDNKLSPLLGLETSGRQEVFGSLDEILEICDNIKGTVPVINFAHIHAREAGGLREPQDFGAVLDRVKDYVGGHHYTHFSGVEHEAGNEKRITPIKKGDLRFEPLAEYLAEENPNITVISSSPLLEHDAMYMKVIYERVLTKRIAKEARLKRNNKASEAVEEEEDLAEDLELEDIDKPPKIKLRNKGGKAPETNKPASPKGDKKATKKK
ncbi:MAG TPA: TIM barrel protein [Methanomassiliicoccaceae archaeon]|nr:TIM barrel protein [Methanomassiliicoccaceae archaeon]